MKRPLNVYPIGGEEPTNWVAGWNDTHPDTPLQIVDVPDLCQAHLACDLAADVIDAEIQDRHLPDRPVIWPPYVYNSCGDFMQENSTCYDHLLRTIYGVVTRNSLLATLREAKAALDDASSVVDAGEGEEYAYEHDLRHLEKLIEQLDGGVFIVEEEEVNHLEVVVNIDEDGIPTYSVPTGVHVRVFDQSLEEPTTFLYTSDGAVDRQPLAIEDEHEQDDASPIAHWITSLERADLRRGSQVCLRRECQSGHWFTRLLTAPDTVLASWGSMSEEVLDTDSNEIVAVLEARGYRLLDDPAEFTDPSTTPAWLPAIGEWVTVYPKNNWPAQAFTGRVTAVQGECVTVIDQDNDAWDVDLDQIELAESDDEAADDEEADDDLCDNCFAAGVACDQTCPECGKTLCADCAVENDGLCGGCAAKAEEDESDDADTDEAVQK